MGHPRSVRNAEACSRLSHGVVAMSYLIRRSITSNNSEPLYQKETARNVRSVSNLSETDIFDRLRTSLRAAIQHTKDLAFLPAQGPTYLKLIEELKLIEGAARQAQFWRQDMRWGVVANEMEAFHQKIGQAIRSHQARRIFLRMAEMMQFFLDRANELQNAKTGRMGAILPKVQPGPHRETRPVHISKGGIILPSAA